MYAYYHYSGLAALVNKARAAKVRYHEVCVAFRANKPRSAAEAIEFLRSLSRSRSGPIPDAFVDMVAQFQGDHEEDIDRIVFGACDDIQAIIRESRAVSMPESDGGIGEEGLSTEDRRRIEMVVRKRASELRKRLREQRGKDDGTGLAVDDSHDSKSVLIRWRAKHREAHQHSESEEGS